MQKPCKSVYCLEFWTCRLYCNETGPVQPASQPLPSQKERAGGCGCPEDCWKLVSYKSKGVWQQRRVTLGIWIPLWLFALKKPEELECPPVLQTHSQWALREGCRGARTWNTSAAWQKVFAAETWGSLPPFTWIWHLKDGGGWGN